MKEDLWPYGYDIYTKNNGLMGETVIMELQNRNAVKIMEFIDAFIWEIIHYLIEFMFYMVLSKFIPVGQLTKIELIFYFIIMFANTKIKSKLARKVLLRKYQPSKKTFQNE